MHLISPLTSDGARGSFTLDADNVVGLVWETGPYRLPSTTHISLPPTAEKTTHVIAILLREQGGPRIRVRICKHPLGRLG
jgi:hypothetical protein